MSFSCLQEHVRSTNSTTQISQHNAVAARSCVCARRKVGFWVVCFGFFGPFSSSSSSSSFCLASSGHQMPLGMLTIWPVRDHVLVDSHKCFSSASRASLPKSLQVPRISRKILHGGACIQDIKRITNSQEILRDA